MVWPDLELGDRFAPVINPSDSAVTDTPKSICLFLKVYPDSFTIIGSGVSPKPWPYRCHTPVISTLRGPEQEKHKLKASLGYIVRPCLTKAEQKMNKLADDQYGGWGRQESLVPCFYLTQGNSGMSLAFSEMGAVIPIV